MMAKALRENSKPPDEIYDLLEKAPKRKLMPILELLRMAYYGVSDRTQV